MKIRIKQWRIEMGRRKKNEPVINSVSGAIRHEAFLVVSKKDGIRRVTKTQIPLNGDEISFRLVVEIPDEYWKNNVQTVMAVFSKDPADRGKIISAIEHVEI